MRRALPSTLALLLAAGVGFIGPALVEPEPVDPMADGAVATVSHLTVVQVAAIPYSPVPGVARVHPITTDQPTERTISCNTL